MMLAARSWDRRNGWQRPDAFLRGGVATYLPVAPRPSSFPLLGPSHPFGASCHLARGHRRPCPCPCRRWLAVRPRSASLKVSGDQVGSGRRVNEGGARRTKGRIQNGRIENEDRELQMKGGAVIDCKLVFMMKTQRAGAASGYVITPSPRHCFWSDHQASIPF